MKEEHVYRLQFVFADGEDSTCTSLVTPTKLLMLFPWLRAYEAIVKKGKLWEVALFLDTILIRIELSD